MRRARAASNKIFSQERAQDATDLVATMAAPIPRKPLRTTFELLQALVEDECCCGGYIPNSGNGFVFCGRCRQKLEGAGLTLEMKRAEAEYRLAKDGSDVPLASFQRCADHLLRLK